MKVSKEQLKALIKEELEAVMKEAESDLEEATRKMGGAKGKDLNRKVMGKQSAADKAGEEALAAARFRDGLDGARAAAKKRGASMPRGETVGADGDKRKGTWDPDQTLGENVDGLEEGQEELEETVEVQEESVEKVEEKKEEPKDKDKMEEGEDKQMEQIAESFRRFTKILKG